MQEAQATVSACVRDAPPDAFLAGAIQSTDVHRRSSRCRLCPLGCHPAKQPPLIACQLGELNEVAAGVVQHRNGRGGHVGGRHRELGAAGLDPLVVALDVVGVEHGRGLALLKDRLLIRFGRGVVVQRQLQLSAVRFLGRGHGQPAIWAITEIGLLGKAQYLRIEAQGLVLVVHVYTGQFDFHFVSPLSRSRFGPRRLLFVFHFRWC